MKNKTPLYYLTAKNDKTEIEISAEVPHTSIARGLEDKTKRIALYNSVDDALCVLSIGRGNLSGQVLSVYSPSYLNSNNILPPDPNLVPYKDKLEGKENWVLLDSLRLIKVCDIMIGEKIGSRKFKYGDRILKKASIKEGEMTKYEWNEVLPEWDKKGKTMKLKRKNFGSTAARITEDKPVAREAGLVTGSALIGAGAGLGVKGLADNANKVLDRVTYRPIKKTVEENGKKIEKVVELKERAGVAKVTRKLRPGAEKLQKFAQTKGGKAALIGIPTAVIGGVVYKSAKKKNKKSDKKEGEEK